MKFETRVPFVKLNYGLYIKLLKDEIQDGGGRHIENRKSAITFEPMDGFSRNLKREYFSWNLTIDCT